MTLKLFLPGRRSALLLVFGLLLAATHPHPALAQNTNGRLYVVAHVDSTPDHATETAKLLQVYGADTRKDPGAVRIDVLVEPGRRNHFTLVEVWDSRAAFEAHLANQHTKAFREKLHAWLGSPYDERLNEEFK